jgi:hypothetical protein
MVQPKVPSERTISERVRAVTSDAFMPVPAKARRYGRGVQWAYRSGIPEPDLSRLSLMRIMERNNRG